MDSQVQTEDTREIKPWFSEYHQLTDNIQGRAELRGSEKVQFRNVETHAGMTDKLRCFQLSVREMTSSELQAPERFIRTLAASVDALLDSFDTDVVFDMCLHMDRSSLQVSVGMMQGVTHRKLTSSATASDWLQRLRRHHDKPHEGAPNNLYICRVPLVVDAMSAQREPDILATYAISRFDSVSDAGMETAAEALTGMLETFTERAIYVTNVTVANNKSDNVLIIVVHGYYVLNDSPDQKRLDEVFRLADTATKPVA